MEERFAGSIMLDVSDARITERGRVTHGKCCGGTFSFHTVDREERLAGAGAPLVTFEGDIEY